MAPNNKKQILINKKPIYVKLTNIYGLHIFKSKITAQLYNNNVYKSLINLNKINCTYKSYVNTYSTFNIGLDKNNSKKYNKQKLKIIKKINENKKFYKKYM